MMIKILDKYIAKNVLASIGLVTLLLAGLQIFILLVAQLDSLGKEDFGIIQVITYVLMQVPFNVYLFFPVACLLGSLVGLAVLANHSELIVMRAAGMSIGQITGSVLKAALVVIFLVTLLGETLIPWLTLQAADFKSAALSGGQSIRTAQGLWYRFNNDFITIGSVEMDNTLEDVYEFRFDDQHNLIMARVIGEAKFVDNAWVANNVEQTTFAIKQTKAEKFSTMPWDVELKPQILKITSSGPNEMTLRELKRYLREQRGGHQNVQNYKLAFLQRITQPINSMVMMLLAIPFIFGPLRSSSMGSKLLVGATVGFGFHMVNRFFGPISAVYQLPVELAAIGPTVIFAALGFYLMRRVK